MTDPSPPSGDPPLRSIEARARAVDAVPEDRIDDALPELRVDLVNAQSDLEERPFPVLVLLMGNDRIACDRCIDRLHEWMDARYLQTEVFLAPTEWEAEHPRFWRYWAALPPHGRVGIFGGGWPLSCVSERVRGELDDAAFARRIDHCRNLEEALVADGTVIVKLWLHASHRKLRKHLARAHKDRREAVHVEEIDEFIAERYDEALEVADRYVDATDTERAPWTILSTDDRKSCEFLSATRIRDAIRERLDAPDAPDPAAESIRIEVSEVAREEDREEAPIPSALAAVDLSARLDVDEYEERLAHEQARLVRWQRRARRAGVTSVIALEGWDAGGKGGAIRRIIRPLPSRDYRVIPIGAPTDEESAHHHLWRFWRRLPRAGRMVIFDRSWYGRVLVERVEGFATTAEWGRAYGEIDDFEAQLVEHGSPVLKFWLHLSPEEQLRRFEARERTPYKKYKITDEDYRNRKRWDDYVRAVDEMVHRTSSGAAPWHLIAAEDKRWARVRVVEAVSRGLKRAVKAAGR